MIRGMSQFKLEDILTEKQVHSIVKEYVPQDDWELIDSKVSLAADGIAGFLGDHLKATLLVRAGRRVEEIKLFIKRMPRHNKPKADFIEQNHFFRREMIMFQLFKQLHADEGVHLWCTKALVVNPSMLVMPDLSATGYAPRPQLLTLDLPHARLTAAALGRYHAAFANHETRNTVDPLHPYNFQEENNDIMVEPTFVDSPWLRAAAKLSAQLLNTFSVKYNHIDNLEEKMYEVFLQACESLREHEGTLNVVNHKDLWVNNIMFKYENGVPVNAILIDFQCVRYAPPAFDLMTFLYLATSRDFREAHEQDILNYYYSVFYESLEEGTKEKLKGLKYDRKEFLAWCERGRQFGLVEAIAIFPYVLMDPVTAQRTYDDPETYVELLGADRTAPALAHARRCAVYRQRQVEVAEEFVERYILNH